MPMSEYVASMRSLVGHRMLLLPAVTRSRSTVTGASITDCP